MARRRRSTISRGLVAVWLALGLVACGRLVGLEELSGTDLPGAASASGGFGGNGPGSGGANSNSSGTGASGSASGGAGTGASGGNGSSSSASGGMGGWPDGGPPCSECALAEWTQTLSGSLAQVVDDVAVAVPSGKIAFAGSLAGTSDFNGQCPPTVNCPHVSAGMNDVVVGVLDVNGAPLWSRSFGDFDDQIATGVAIDKNDNTTVVGTFKGTLNPGGGLLSSASLSSFDVFAARYDALGNHLGSNKFGDNNNQFAQDVVVDVDGNVIIVGFFNGAIDFGCMNSLGAMGSYDMFIAKLKPDLTCLWNKRFGTIDATRAIAVAVDSQSNVIVTGRFHGTIDFGDPSGPKTSPDATEDIFAVKLSTNGDPIWGKMFVCSGNPDSRSIAIAADDSVYMTGNFTGSLNFVSGDNPMLVGTDLKDAFVAKLDPATGDAVWSRSFGEVGDQSGEGIAVTPDGHVFVTGGMAGAAPFGGKMLQSAGGKDLFVLQFDAQGTPQCGIRFGDAADQSGKTLTVDNQGQLVLGIDYQGTLNLGCATRTSLGLSDILLTRMSH